MLATAASFIVLPALRFETVRLGYDVARRAASKARCPSQRLLSLEVADADASPSASRPSRARAFAHGPARPAASCGERSVAARAHAGRAR